jgi:hypothetical protein
MTTQPKSTAAPMAAPPTHNWRDALVVMGAIVLLAIVGLVVCVEAQSRFAVAPSGSPRAGSAGEPSRN